jgi:release factor glutamine methyltransferase
VARVLRWASEDFARRGLESARLEAELLLGEVLGLDRIGLLLAAERDLSDGELGAYRELIRRRRGGEPTAYLLGRREFFGRRFRSDARALVPRPDTEILVEELLARTQHRALFGRYLDLCTGSGCVAISFALARRTWQVTGTDLSESALELARENALALGAVWGVRWLLGDLFAALPAGERFEVISANPPYIPSGELAELAPEVREFEPRAALDGGADGLDFYRRLAREAPSWLVPGGVLALEVGAGQAEAVSGLLRDAGFVHEARRRDYGGHERVVSARRPRSG